jgi:hypothetical protein
MAWMPVMPEACLRHDTGMTFCELDRILY